jgi:selenocysteine lyase/cysteine desulfurase
MAADWDALERHEACLTTYALERLQSLPGITIYGASEGRCADRVGVIPFNLGDRPHALVAAILGYEGGIGVRSGCFCAQPYVAHLLGRDESEPGRWLSARPAGDTSPRPGMVRVSLGAYNTSEDVDVLVEMLGRIMRNDYRGQYYCVPEGSDYRPVGYQDLVHRLAVRQPAEASA